MITLILKVINETEKHRDQLRQSTWLEKQPAPEMMVIIPHSTEKLYAHYGKHSRSNLNYKVCEQ